MKTLLQYTLLVYLLAPCYLSAQTADPYDLQLRRASHRFSSAEKLEKLILLSQISRLRDYVGDRPHLIALIDSIAGNSSEPEIIRQEASAIHSEVLGESSNPPRWYKNETLRGQVIAEATQHLHAGDAQSYEILAELEFMAGLPDAAKHMQRAAQISPSAERWQRAALFSDDPFQKFAALQAGLALDGANSRLNLQLAAYYIGRNQLEKAHDLLSRAITASPDDFVLRERRAGLYLSLGLRSQAVRDLQSLEEQFPHPLWLKARLATDYQQLGLLQQAAHLAASVLSEDKDELDMLALLIRFHESRHMSPELRDDYTALSRLQPQAAEVWRKLSRLQLDCGDFSAARSSLLRLVELDKSDVDAHRLLAETYQRLHLESDAREELAAAERLRQRQSESPDRTETDAHFMADASELAKAAFLHPPSSADVVLANIRVQQLYPNGLDRIHVQQIFYIGSDAAIDSHRLTEIRHSPSSESLNILHARAWKANGQILDAQDLGDQAPSESPVSMYYDVHLRQLRFPGLEQGDVVEIEYSLSPVLPSSPYGDYFGELVFFASHTITELQRYVLIAPATKTIYAHAEKVHPAAVYTQGDSRIFVWDSRHTAALVGEPRSPGLTETAPYVHVSTFADWQQLGAWYANLVRPQFVLDQPLQEELSRLIQGTRNEREKIAAIQDFVLRSTHYVAQEFGIYSYKPYPVAQTYARRYGDCKDKASLMIALLRAAGIDARLALLRTRSLGAVAVQPASVALFDHAIVYIPKYDLWLDGTAEYALRELPLEDQGALALIVGLDGAAQLRHTPMSRASDNYTKHTIQAQLTSKGTIGFSGSTVARGEDAPGLRQELSVREQQLDSLRRDLAQVFPTVQVYSVNVRDQKWAEEEPEDGEISVEFRGDLNSTRQKHLVSLSSSWMPRSYAAALAPSGSRNQDLLLFAPWITEEEIHIALPAGARVSELPPDKTITTVFGNLKLRYRKLAGSIVVQSHVQFDRSRVAAADYPAFREFCLLIERSFREAIKVELPQ